MAKNRSRPRNLGLVLLLVCGAAGNAASAWAQERLSNRFFDADISGWTVSPGGSASWSGDDRLGSLSSGSAILVTTRGQGTGDGVSQCVAVEEGQDFLATAWGREPSGQSEPGLFRLLVQFFFAPGCDDADFLQAQSCGLVNPVLDSWELCTVEGVVPQGAVSAAFLPIAHKGSGGVSGMPFEVHLDDVSLLVGLGRIFRDGFESGDTNLWPAP